jgi:aryl-alcohol dehydrogenase-like predicted oxidoreductase/predicted kinase
MRLSTDGDRDDALARDTIATALDAGITIFDTAHAYGAGQADVGGNERLVARALRTCDADRRARVVTKGGMTRADGGWVPDGRAKAILGDCEASLAALDGLAIDLYLMHAPDPRTPWQTSVRALARLLHEGAVRRVGLANVNRRQLEEAVDLVEIAAIQVALSPLDDGAVRAGLLDFCAERGIAVIAHSPLGGPRRARSLARRQELVDIARARGATPEEVALAWLLALSPAVVAIPGARRPATARSAARAATLPLEPSDRARIATGFAWPRPGPADRSPTQEAEVVVVMGVPGAGKSRHAEGYVERGYVRLNRDERGGSLRQLSRALDHALSSGARRVVLDNTYLTREVRSHVIETARNRARVRCVWVDTPLAHAQRNLVERLLDRFGSLPDTDELRRLARDEPGILTPTRQMRAMRELEPPSIDEGFVAIERISFARAPKPSMRSDTQGGVFVAAAALNRPNWEDAIARGAPARPHLLFDWRPDATVDVLDADAARLSAEISGPVSSALCPHAAGPPACWCRPPIPGLILAFARTHDIDPSASMLIGAGPAHRTLATTLDADYIGV